MSDDRLAYDGLDPLSSNFPAAGLDLREAFYQNTARDFGSLFGFNFPETADTFGVSCIYDEASGTYEAVGASDLLYQVYEGLAPGFSWSMYFCQDLTSQTLLEAATFPGIFRIGEPSWRGRCRLVGPQLQQSFLRVWTMATL